MSVDHYTVELPASAVIVTTWEELYSEAKKYPDTALFTRYGGNVIEVDGDIKMATDKYMTEQIAQKMASIKAMEEAGKLQGTGEGSQSSESASGCNAEKAKM